jgi:uncharacterized membrane protein YhaH (DUF805 family)
MQSEQSYWFQAKQYGWGWGLPISWHGWVVLLVFAVLMGAAAFVFPPDSEHLAFLVCTAVLSSLLIGVCWLKGEPPRWRWGRDD